MEPDDFANKFEYEVASFLEELGFSDVAGGRNFHIGALQVDACGGFSKTLIVVECIYTSGTGDSTILKRKISELAGRAEYIKKGRSVNAGYRKYSELRFVIAVRGFDVTDDIRIFADKTNPSIAIWDEQFFEYYRELMGTLGRFAIYNLLGELDIRPDMPPISVPALLIRAGGKKLYSFFADPWDLLRVAFVARRESGREKFYQRIVDRRRLAGIARYIEEGKVFPNNVVVAFNGEVSFDGPETEAVEPDSNAAPKVVWGTLTLPNSFRGCWLIDGQHRLFAFSKVSERSVLSMIPVTAFEDLTLEEQATYFLDINKMQKPVPPDLIWDLEGEIWPETREGMISNTAKELNESSPLAGKIYIPLKGRKKTGQLKLSGICDAIKKRHLVDKRTYHMKMKDPHNSLYRESSHEQVEVLSKALADYLSCINYRCEKELLDGFLFLNSGLSILIAFYEVILVRLRKIPKEDDLDKYVDAMNSYLVRAYPDTKALELLRLRCNSEGGRDSVVEEIVTNIADELNDKELLFALPGERLLCTMDSLDRLSCVAEDFVFLSGEPAAPTPLKMACRD